MTSSIAFYLVVPRRELVLLEVSGLCVPPLLLQLLHLLHGVRLLSRRHESGEVRVLVTSHPHCKAMTYACCRFFVICYPMKAQYVSTSRRARIIICLVWGFALVLASPVAVQAVSDSA